MNDFNIIICCKLRERVIRECESRPALSGLTDSGIFIKLCGRNGETGRTRAGARPPRSVITDFHARLRASIPARKAEIDRAADRRYAPRPETNIVPVTERVRVRVAERAVRVRAAKVRPRITADRRAAQDKARIASSVEIDGNGNKRRYAAEKPVRFKSEFDTK